MKYESEIIRILSEADIKEGLPIRHIVRHVYNMTCCDMFSSVPLSAIRKDVEKCLHAEAKVIGGSIQKAKKRGYYRINRKSSKLRQLLLDFNND